MTAAAFTSLAAVGCSEPDRPTADAVADDTTAEPDPTPDSGTTEPGHDHVDIGGVGPESADLRVATRAAAAFQDVSVAEAAGYADTIDALGCFEHAEEGGMGLHFVNDALMDSTLDITRPEALVYELDVDGDIVQLVAHEYIVPVEAWTEAEPPELFGRSLHQHATLPLFVLHTWIWKDNPAGVFADWNPKVRRCPDSVPVFGVDLP